MMMYIHQSGIPLASLQYGTTKKAVHAALHHMPDLLLDSIIRRLPAACLCFVDTAACCCSCPYCIRAIQPFVLEVDLLICSKSVLDVTIVAPSIHHFLAGKHGVQLASRSGYCHCGHRRQQNLRSGRPWHQWPGHLHRSAASALHCISI